MTIIPDKDFGATYTGEDATKARQMMLHMALSNFLDKPCPICGKAWKDVQDLIDSEAVCAGINTAAHKSCWDKWQTTK